jgi:LysM repeat protein
LSSFRLKLPASTKDRFLEAYNDSSFQREVKFLTYKVHRGETLNHVARHFGIQVDPIADLNGVSSRMPLRNGVHVLLPIPTDRSRSLASLDLKDPPFRRRGYGRGKRRNHRFYKITYKRRESARSSGRKSGNT